MCEMLADIARAEELIVDDFALDIMAELAHGDMRQAIGYLENAAYLASPVGPESSVASINLDDVFSVTGYIPPAFVHHILRSCCPHLDTHSPPPPPPPSSATPLPTPPLLERKHDGKETPPEPPTGTDTAPDKALLVETYCGQIIADGYFVAQLFVQLMDTILASPLFYPSKRRIVHHIARASSRLATNGDETIQLSHVLQQLLSL